MKHGKMEDGEKQRLIWITWERQRRNRALSAKFGAELYELESKRTRVLRYIILSVKTISIMASMKPTHVFVQNPSIALTVVTGLLRPIMGFCLVIDCHNSGIFPLEGKYPFLNRIFSFINSLADFVIVTNFDLKRTLKIKNQKILVLPDPLPEKSNFYSINTNVIQKENSPENFFVDEVTNIVFVCTWADDEPYRQVIEAARKVKEINFKIFITGTPKIVVKDSRSVTFTGFLCDEDYYALIEACDAVIVLTNREMCLTCGAYEALSLSKPGILSNTRAIRELFKTGYIFSDPSVEALASSIKRLVSDIECLKKEVLPARNEYIENYEKVFRKVKMELNLKSL